MHIMYIYMQYILVNQLIPLIYCIIYGQPLMMATNFFPQHIAIHCFECQIQIIREKIQFSHNYCPFTTKKVQFLAFWDNIFHCPPLPSNLVTKKVTLF